MIRNRMAAIAALALLVGSGAQAQTASSMVMADVGIYTAGELRGAGPTLGLRFDYAPGPRIVHQGGVRLAVDMGGELDCVGAPDGGCLNSIREPALATLFYELRRLFRDPQARIRPYIGGRASFARGWDSVGGGAGVTYGLQLGSGLTVDIGGTTEYLGVWPRIDETYPWHGLVSGLRLGLGVGF